MARNPKDPYGPSRRQTPAVPYLRALPSSSPRIEVDEEEPTAVHCPACEGCLACHGRHLLPSSADGRAYGPCAECADCSYCQGMHLVTPERAVAYRKE